MRKMWVLVVLLACSCVTARVMNRISPGMRRQQVIRALGQPDSVSDDGETEYLSYRFPETGTEWWLSVERFYFVRLVDGRVDAYGRQGDFNSNNPLCQCE